MDPLPPHGLLALVALVAAIAAQGAYYGGGRLLVAGVLVVTLVAALRASPWSGGDALGPCRAAAALAGWAAVCAALAGEVTAALPGIGLLAGVVVVLLAVRRLTRDQRDTLAEAVLVVGGLAAVTGWAGVAWRIPPWAVADQGLWRAATTLTYANAAAGLLVPLALLALARLATRPRVPAVVCACLLLTGAGATLSRGGALALAVGLAVLAGVLGPARILWAAGPPALGAALALAGLAPSMSASSPPRPLLAAAALLAGLALSVGAARLRGRQLALVLAAAAVATVATVAAGAVGGTAGSVAGDLAPSRLTVASPDRVAAARAALRVAADRPLTGAGPDRAVLTWGEDGRRMTSRYAHNEYLQVLAELGLVGLALLSVLLASAGWTVWRGRPHAPSVTVWAGAVAGLTASAVHSAFDFLWHLPAIPLAGAVLAGLVLPPAIDQEGGARPPGSPTEEE